MPGSCAPAPLLYGPTQSSGASVAWVARLLGCRPADVPALAARASAGPCPAFVPYLSGERAPLWNADVRGLLLGLAAEHGPAEIARAVLTGTLLSARHVLDAVEAATGDRIAEIEFTGRGAGDPAWEAIALETLGARVRFHSDPDLSARGAAMLAAIMTGASPAQASAVLGDATRTAAPSAAELARAGGCPPGTAGPATPRWPGWRPPEVMRMDKELAQLEPATPRPAVPAGVIAVVRASTARRPGRSCAGSSSPRCPRSS